MGLWKVTADLAGPLFLVHEISTLSASPPHPAIRKLCVSPKNDKQTAFELQCWVEIDGNDASTRAQSVVAIAHDCVYSLRAYLGLMLWHPLTVTIKSMVTETPLNANGEKRMICVSESGTEVLAPTMLTEPGVLKHGLDPTLRRAAIWTLKALSEADYYDRFLDLMFVASLLAPRFPGAANRERTCPHCRTVDTLQPGDAEYFKNLCLRVGIDTAQANEMWSMRGKLAHGGIEINTGTHEQLFDLVTRLEDGIRKAFRLLLGPGSVPERAPGWRVDLTNALLDIKYTEPPSAPTPRPPQT